MPNDHTLTVERLFHVSPKVLWEALTDREKLKQWYFDIPQFNATPGSVFTFEGQGRKGEKYTHSCKVLESLPEKKLSYSWSYEGLKGYSVLTFELFPEGNDTRLRLTHEGLASFEENGPDFAVESFKGGWDYIINTSLKNYFENH